MTTNNDDKPSEIPSTEKQPDNADSQNDVVQKYLLAAMSAKEIDNDEDKKGGTGADEKVGAIGGLALELGGHHKENEKVEKLLASIPDFNFLCESTVSMGQLFA